MLPLSVTNFKTFHIPTLVQFMSWQNLSECPYLTQYLVAARALVPAVLSREAVVAFAGM